MQPGESRRKLWTGFWIMCAAVLVWIVTTRLAMAPMMNLPPSLAGKTTAEMQEQLKKLQQAMVNPGRMVNWMTIGHGLSGVLLVAGVMVAGMGLVEYSAELRGSGRD